jgi:phosphoenolpyruvate carboxykinase (ATP)
MRKIKIPTGKSASSKLSRRMAPPGPDIASFASKQSYHNLTAAELFERALTRGEGHVSDNDALVVLTGHHTGRSASDKFVVRDAASEKQV